MAPRKYTIQDMKKKAKEFGGQCLSKEYKNINEKLKWKCKKGHVFTSFANNVFYHNKWCAICGIDKRAKAQANTIEDCHNLAKLKGGKCLSKIYKNVGQQIHWECAKGHKWHAPYRQIKGSKKREGTWCPKCNGRKPKNITFARELGKSLGIQCLSTDYINYNSKLNWQCKNGHLFDQSLSKLAARKRCPKCHIYFGEEICRNYFEAIFDAKFPKYKPEFLKLSKGKYLELDGYNEKLKLAFEHHGMQHYQFNSKFHVENKSFDNRQSFDQTKLELCRSNHVKVVVIPAIPEKLKIEDLPAFLKSELDRLEISYIKENIPNTISIESPSINKTLDELKKIAISRGGKLISKFYYASGEKLKWKCAENHIWMASAENIKGNKSKKGTWCPKCKAISNALRNSDTIEHMEEVAKNRGGKCISAKYINAQTKIEWECSKKHRWFATPNSITSNKTWCPYCAGKAVNLDTINKWISEYNGECISKKYVDNISSLKWKCDKNHVFELPLRSMQRRIKDSHYFCFECSKSGKKLIK